MSYPPPAQDPNQPDPAGGPRRHLNPQHEGASALVLIGLIAFIVYMRGGGLAETAVVVVIGAVCYFVYLVFRALQRAGDRREPAQIVIPPVQPPVGPPPGWYVDPQGATRWHDGHQWTDVVQHPPQPPTGQ